LTPFTPVSKQVGKVCPAGQLIQRPAAPLLFVIDCTHDKCSGVSQTSWANLICAKRSIRYKQKRLEGREPRDQMASDWTAKLNRHEVIERSRDADVRCGPANSTAEIFAEEQF
jgi:crotonobetainyl-CoA:carnitine CoA-transferase CaiB-like acyl-CoA transferase